MTAVRAPHRRRRRGRNAPRPLVPAALPPAWATGGWRSLLRTGQVRVDGRRAKANQRLEAGQTVRVPPLGDLDAPKPKPERAPVAEAEAEKS